MEELPPNHPPFCNKAGALSLGRDMGGCKTYGGRKTYQRTRSPENFWTPPKKLLVCSVVDFVQEKQSADA